MTNLTQLIEKMEALERNRYSDGPTWSEFTDVSRNTFPLFLKALRVIQDAAGKCRSCKGGGSVLVVPANIGVYDDPFARFTKACPDCQPLRDVLAEAERLMQQ